MTLGFTLGIMVLGFMLGFTLGFMLLGFMLGITLGFALGFMLGVMLGIALGFMLGFTLGFTVGIILGFMLLGFTLGIKLGLGDEVGLTLGLEISFVRNRLDLSGGKSLGFEISKRTGIKMLISLCLLDAVMLLSSKLLWAEVCKYSGSADTVVHKMKRSAMATFVELNIPAFQ